MDPEPCNEGDVTTDPYVPVGEFFSERAVFITGGTGFLGKVLVEKLLRSCPGVKVIYLLMRPKRGLDPEARLAEIVKAPLFDSLRKESPLALNKIVLINGDIAKPELGISPEDQELLVRTVSIVFHSAATIKFNEPLKVAVQTNMMGTKRLIELCRRMHDLRALVHVSTCYSNCGLEEVREVVYPPPYDPDKILQCTEWMDDELLDHITPTLLGKLPNTYVFTKALTESMILKEAGNLPVAIVRPSIVISSWKQPMPGWVEGISGPTAIVTAWAKGVLRSIIVEEDYVADLIPVDVVINLMICVAWETATRPVGVRVFNCSSGYRRPVTWRLFTSFFRNGLHQSPSSYMMWYPTLSLTSHRIVNRIRTMVCQLLPAFTIDLVSRIIANQPSRMVDTQARLKAGVEVLLFFTTRQWRFYDDNVQHLRNSLQGSDRRKYTVDVSEINWKTYIHDYWLGIRKFLLKENPATIPEARKHLRILLWIHRLFKTLPIFILITLVYLGLLR